MSSQLRCCRAAVAVGGSVADDGLLNGINDADNGLHLQGRIEY